MDDVKDSDHVIALVDNIPGKSAKGGAVGGQGSYGGKMATVVDGWRQSISGLVKGAIHEIGHNLGLGHTFGDRDGSDGGDDGFPDTIADDPNNFMSYDTNKYPEFSYFPRQYIYRSATQDRDSGKQNYNNDSDHNRAMRALLRTLEKFR